MVAGKVAAFALALLQVATLAGCGPAVGDVEESVTESQPSEPSVEAGAAALRVETIEGKELTPLRPPPGAFTCLLFVTVDCPVANKFAPEIADLAGTFADQPVQFVLVHVDPDVDANAAREHARDYGLDIDLVLDPEHRLVAASGVTITPEAAVFDEAGRRLYRGRIDDRFGRLGSRRPQPSHRDLRNALTAVLRGETPNPAETDAVGCIIADFR